LTVIKFSSKQHWGNSFFMIDGSLQSTKIVSNKLRNLYDYLPKANARQQITTETEADLCIKAAYSS